MQVSSWMVHMESALTKGGSLVDDLNARCVLFIKVCSVPVYRTRELRHGLHQHSFFSWCVFVLIGCPYCTHCESLGAHYHEHASGTVQTADQGCCVGPVQAHRTSQGERSLRTVSSINMCECVGHLLYKP